MKSITLRTRNNGYESIRKVTLTVNGNNPKLVTLIGNLPHLCDLEVTQELIDFLQDTLDNKQENYILQDFLPYEDEWIFVTDSQEIKSICDYLGLNENDITGAMVKINDGDYESVYVTESSAPYSILARYYRAKGE